MLPFLVYGLIILVPLLLLMSPFNLTNMERNPGSVGGGAGDAAVDLHQLQRHIP
jgi:hypothetical protein